MNTSHEKHRRFPWRPCLAVFVLALGVRIFFLTLIPGDAIRPSPDWEIDSIAMSLVRTGHFADAYAVPTGPTAHLPPIPPLMLALVYKIFGITMTAGIVEWTLYMLFQALILGLLPWIGESVGLGWRAGLTGGLAGALWPQWIGHGEGLAAVLLGLLVVAIVRRWDRVAGRNAASGPEPSPGGLPRPLSSLLLGAAFGFSFHVQPVFLLVFLGYLAFELWWRSGRGKWRSAGLVSLGALLICFPWGVRNYRAFDAVFFVRSNFGLELRMGNHEGATANIDDPHFRHWPPHPRSHPEEAVKVKDMGEVPYIRESRREAMSWIEAHPGEFARLTAKRIRYFWLGPLDDPGMELAFVALAGLALFGAALVAATGESAGAPPAPPLLKQLCYVGGVRS